MRSRSLPLLSLLLCACLGTPTATIAPPAEERDVPDLPDAPELPDEGDAQPETDAPEHPELTPGGETATTGSCSHASIAASIGCGETLVADDLYEAVLHDQNEDGCMDIVLLSIDPPKLVVLFGNDALDFTCAAEVPLATPGGKTVLPHAFVIGDFDGEGAPDALVIASKADSFWFLGFDGAPGAGFAPVSHVAELAADVLDMSPGLPWWGVAATLAGAGPHVVFGDNYVGAALRVDWTEAALPVGPSHLIRLDGGGANQTLIGEVREGFALEGAAPGFQDILLLGRSAGTLFRNAQGDVNDEPATAYFSDFGGFAWSVNQVDPGAVDAVGVTPTGIVRLRLDLEGQFSVDAEGGKSALPDVETADAGLVAELDGSPGLDVVVLDGDSGGGPGSSGPPYHLFVYPGMAESFPPLEFAHPRDSKAFPAGFTPRRVFAGDASGDGETELLVLSRDGRVLCFRMDADHDLVSCP